MRQECLFYDSCEQSVAMAINDSAKTWQQVAHALWPAMKMASAYARLKNCLNEERDEKLSFAEIILICNFTERYYPLYHFAGECNHSKPELVKPEDQEALLRKQFIEAAQVLKTIGARLEKLEG